VSSAEQMKVEMIHGLSAILTRIHNDAVAIAKTFLAGNLCRGPMQVAQHGPVGFAGILHGADMFTGDDQHMHGSLRMKVRECVADVVLIDGGGRDGAFSDLAEDAAHGEPSLHRLDLKRRRIYTAARSSGFDIPVFNARSRLRGAVKLIVP
jgi:hypothetical protein